MYRVVQDYEELLFYLFFMYIMLMLKINYY